MPSGGFMLVLNGLNYGIIWSDNMRNVIAIIGTAGRLPRPLRLQIEALSEQLTSLGFDIVSGGMTGAMRAVARGHSKSLVKTNLTHIEPGWGFPLVLNPFEAGIVRTDLGSMRNHLVIRSADLVIAVSGGAGTLSEIAIAWQEKKPIAVLTGSGGWSEKLADQSIDQRRTDSIKGCDTVQDLVDWAVSLCPEGVYAGRMNRGFYPFEVPTIHRIHDSEPGIVHTLHAEYGMSIKLEDLIERLKELDSRAKEWDPECTALVTFDDGWADVLLLEDTFERLPNLTPVLFIPESQFQIPVHPLPLQRYYQFSSEQESNSNSIREELKAMSEESAHLRLDELGVNEMLNPSWLLTLDEISRLSEKGWIIASHGHSHEDLRKSSNILEPLHRVAEAIEERVHMPWLAWPEGQWSKDTILTAKKAGFMRQFGLLDEPHEEPPIGMIMRKIWS